MAATVEICESNGAGETVTHNISNANMGNTDAANLDPVAYPVTPGNNTYEKFQRLHVTNMGGSSKIDNIQVWRSGALGGSATHKTNARTTSYAQVTYATPDTTEAAQSTQDMPTSDPGAANLGIGGSLTGSLTSAGYSDYLNHIIKTNAGDTAGSTSTLYIQYDETA